MNIHNNIRSIVLCGAMLLLSLGMNAQRERICIDDNWQFAFGNASSMENDAKESTLGNIFFDILKTLGTARVIIIPIIIKTDSSSTNVNPFLFILSLPLPFYYSIFLGLDKEKV